MADGKVDIKTLGRSGVVIDLNQYDPGVPDDSLRAAQNATHDPTAGFGGAIRKRPGLRQFNKAWAGGPILGGIPMLVAGTGGAPATSVTPGTDDPTGSSVGAGTGTGAPGASTGGTNAAGPGGGGGNITGNGGGTGPASNVPSSGVGLFATAAASYPGSRLMIVGRANNFNPGDGNGLPDSNGWYIVRSDWATALAAKHQDATPGPPDGYGPTNTIYPPTALFRCVWGRPSVFDPATGFLFYAASHLRSAMPPGGSLNATIRKTNGATDVLVTTLGASLVIQGMCLSDDGSALIATAHSTTVANSGNLYRIDKATGVVTPFIYRIDQVFPGAPFCVTTFNGKLYIGEWQQTGNEVGGGSSTQIDGTPAQDTTQQVSIDHGFSFGGNPGVTTCLAAFPKADPFNQILFAGFGVNGASYAQVYVRQRTGIGDTGTPWVGSFTPSDTSPIAGNHFTSFCEFQGNLYTSWRNGGTGHNAYIFKFVPNFTHTASDGGWDGTGTWSTVYGPIGQGTGQFAWNLITDSGYMYAISGGETNISDNQAVITSDGTTWTDKSSVIFDHGVNDDCPIPYYLFVNP